MQQNLIGEAAAMCAEAKNLITAYLDVIEEYDRVHLMFLAASRRGDPQAREGYRGLLRDAKSKLQAARGRLQDHQKTHDCFEAIRFEDMP